MKDYSFLFPSETIKKMISTYPEKKSCSIKEVLSSKLTIASNNFLITNGSLEGMNIIIANLVQNNIGYLTPTFWGYDFLIDESMLPYKYDFFNYTMIPFVEKYTNLIVCSSISKSLCAPGLRIGYICANEKIVKKLEKKVIPFNVSNINQCIAEKILENFPLSLSI
ncbi:aminotransferase class I/II-fold pyridoxal phosphate-dependent enzyme, partial [Streptococcus pneumoniae]|uniref:aminotransferase class I/II-fold pyridoxal phosphate-dependent enzyme n=1 Tax=Streptococcus pneumoniae TaxID=1313 RepID=UPI0038D12486